MILRTTGMALRIDPFSKTSIIVNWLTADHGRLTTLIKSARRPRHLFLGHCDLFHTCDLLYYPGRHSALHVLKECGATEFRINLRTDWRSFACASYLCDLINRMSHPGTPLPEIYEFATETLDFLDRYGSSPSVLYWAEIRLLRMFGVAPRLSTCVSCDKAISTDERPTSFSVPRGGLLCAKCVPRTTGNVYAMSADVLAMLRTWQRSAAPRIAFRTAITAEQRTTIDRIVGAFVEQHLESSGARRIALDLLFREKGRDTQTLNRK